MGRQEFRAAGSLAAVFSVRLLGLFMIYPVFAAYAQNADRGARPLPERSAVPNADGRDRPGWRDRPGAS